MLYPKLTHGNGDSTFCDFPGRAGIWTRDIKSQSGKHQISVNKILRHLEGRQLVKAFKSIKSPSKKYYMLYDLSIPPELGGGVFYVSHSRCCTISGVIFSRRLDAILLSPSYLLTATMSAFS